MLHELDPAGAAGCEHRQRRLVKLVGSNTADQLVGFFQNCKVSRHVHIEHFDVAKHSDRLDHLVFHVGSRRHVKTFTQRSRDGRSGEEYHLLLGIRDSVPYLVDIALLIQSADRTGDDTLSAADTGRGIQALIERRTDADVEASSDLSDRSDALNVVAGGDAAQALNALVVVTDYIRCGIVDLILGLVVLEVIFVNAVIICEFLQFAVVSSHAGKTFLVVRGEDQLDGGLSGRTDRSCICENLQALFYRISTSGSQTASSLDLNNTDTACADAVDVLEVAKRGDLDVDRFGCLKDCSALRDSDRDIINL